MGPGHRPHLGRQRHDSHRPPHREPLLREHDVRDQHPQPDALQAFTESFEAKVTCRFLARIAGHFDRKAHLHVDRHPAHRSKSVRPWLADHQDDIELHFLPSYSPELNPDELVNTDLKLSLPPHPSGQEPVRARRRNPQFLPPAPASTAHRPQLLRRPARPLHLGGEPSEFLIKIRRIPLGRRGAAGGEGAARGMVPGGGRN
ncbi:transposase [Streptomyces sp. NPDC055103]